MTQTGKDRAPSLAGTGAREKLSPCCGSQQLSTTYARLGNNHSDPIRVPRDLADSIGKLPGLELLIPAAVKCGRVIVVDGA
jgi:hypothetical protein